MDGQLTCDNRSTADNVQKAVILALKDFKNPYETGNKQFQLLKLAKVT